MADIKAEELAVLVESAEAQSEKMAEAFTQMQTHKAETDKLLESYNERFSECQNSIEKSNEVSIQFCHVFAAIQMLPAVLLELSTGPSMIFAVDFARFSRC